MPQIDLACPGCSKQIQVDEGFAGGVCRCDECGELMSVPDPRGDGDATSDERPETPLAAPRRAEQVIENTDRPLDRPEIPVVGGKDIARHESAAPIDPPPGNKQKKPAEIPATTGRRRGRLSQWISALAFGAILGSMVGGVLLYVGYDLSQMGYAWPWSEDEEAASDLGAQRPGVAFGMYDADANPFLMEVPNIFGIPAGSTVAVVVDTGGAGSGLADIVRRALLAGLRYPSSSNRAQVVSVTEEGPKVYPDRPVALDVLNRDRLGEYLKQSLRMGVGRLDQAIAVALEQGPAQVVVIRSHAVADAQLGEIEKMVDEAASVRFDEVVIGTGTEFTEPMVTPGRGEHVAIAVGKLWSWHRASR